MVRNICVLILLFSMASCYNPPVAFQDLPQPLQMDKNNRWILDILNYESARGSQNGTGLNYWGNYQQKPGRIEDAIALFHKHYLPRVIVYPVGVRERLGDYYYNTGRRPEDLLLYATNRISLARLNSNENLAPVWALHRKEILNEMEAPGFALQLDTAKDSVYRTTKMIDNQPNPAYAKTWKPRVWMWSKQQE